MSASHFWTKNMVCSCSIGLQEQIGCNLFLICLSRYFYLSIQLWHVPESSMKKTMLWWNTQSSCKLPYLLFSVTSLLKKIVLVCYRLLIIWALYCSMLLLYNIYKNNRTDHLVHEGLHQSSMSSKETDTKSLYLYKVMSTV